MFLHIFNQFVLGAVKCDLCPGLGFAEQVGNVAKVQLAEHAQREDLAVRLFEPVQGGVDAQSVIDGLSPEYRAVFDAASPEEQAALLAQIGVTA